MKKIKYSLDQIENVAKQFVTDIQSTKVVTFTGGLGAGKTTFIRTVLQKMGVTDPITSPTFTYFNQYRASDGRIIYHFDLYRLKDLVEFEAAGFFEYVYQPNSIAFIEWPEILNGALKESCCRAQLSVLSHNERLLEYNCQ